MTILRKSILVIILQFTAIQMYRHNQPVAEKIWSERCTKNSIVLNDCNWCRCNARHKYDCEARVCEEIDMFGHFKDAIQEIDVGMEGHGAWRSKPSACTPGVHYRRGAVLCVCDGDGNWPNPVCRDLFQILHSIELTGQTRLSLNDSCTPTKLYLVGCNVCFCPSSGYLDQQLCTDKECQEDDPVLEANQTPLLTIPPKKQNDVEEVLEIYAMCDPKYNYELGCRNCECLRNNRLLCGDCSIARAQYSDSLSQRSKKHKNKLVRWPSKWGKPGKWFKPKPKPKPKPRLPRPRPPKPTKPPKKPNPPSKPDKPSKPKKPDNPSKPHKPKSVCHGIKPYVIFKMDCNSCHCKKNELFCTSRKCVEKIEMEIKIIEPDENFPNVVAPPDDESCEPGTTYQRDCNVCICGNVEEGVKHIQCTRNICHDHENHDDEDNSKVIDAQKLDCVVGTYYLEHCMVCHCHIKDEVRYQTCRLDANCGAELRPLLTGKAKLNPKALHDVSSLYGICEPRRKYKNGCNMCRCLADGKTLKCSSRICSLRSNNLSVDIVPVVVEDMVECPSGHSYKLDCNLCFCLSNGNAICTTNNCVS